jgi:hypothetical protein
MLPNNIQKEIKKAIAVIIATKIPRNKFKQEGENSILKTIRHL